MFPYSEDKPFYFFSDCYKKMKIITEYILFFGLKGFGLKGFGPFENKSIPGHIEIKIFVEIKKKNMEKIIKMEQLKNSLDDFDSELGIHSVEIYNNLWEKYFYKTSMILYLKFLLVNFNVDHPLIYYRVCSIFSKISAYNKDKNKLNDVLKEILKEQVIEHLILLINKCIQRQDNFKYFYIIEECLIFFHNIGIEGIDYKKHLIKSGIIKTIYNVLKSAEKNNQKEKQIKNMELYKDISMLMHELMSGNIKINLNILQVQNLIYMISIFINQSNTNILLNSCRIISAICFNYPEKSISLIFSSNIITHVLKLLYNKDFKIGFYCFEIIGCIISKTDQNIEFIIKKSLKGILKLLSDGETADDKDMNKMIMDVIYIISNICSKSKKNDTYQIDPSIKIDMLLKYSDHTLFKILFNNLLLNSSSLIKNEIIYVIIVYLKWANNKQLKLIIIDYEIESKIKQLLLQSECIPELFSLCESTSSNRD